MVFFIIFKDHFIYIYQRETAFRDQKGKTTNIVAQYNFVGEISVSRINMRNDRR